MALKKSRVLGYYNGGPEHKLDQNEIYLQNIKNSIRRGMYEEGMSQLYFYLLIQLDKGGLYPLEPWLLNPLSSYITEIEKTGRMIMARLSEKEVLGERDLTRIREVNNLINTRKWAEKHLHHYRYFSMCENYTEIEFNPDELLETKPGGQLFKKLLSIHNSLIMARIESESFIQVLQEMIRPLSAVKKRLEQQMENMVDCLHQFYQLQKLLYVIEDVLRCFEAVCQKDIWESSFIEAIQHIDVIMTLHEGDFQLKEIAKHLLKQEEQERALFENNDEYPF